MTAVPTISIRVASEQDASALLRLAALDSADVPRGQILLAEEDRAVRAALPLDGGRPIADPFAPTTHLLALLELRAARLRGVTGAHGGRAHRGRPAGRARARRAVTS